MDFSSLPPYPPEAKDVDDHAGRPPAGKSDRGSWLAAAVVVAVAAALLAWLAYELFELLKHLPGLAGPTIA